MTLKLSDAEVLISQVSNIIDVSPFSRMPGTAVKYQELSSNPSVQAVTPSYTSVWDIDVSEGRFISYEDDFAQCTCLCYSTYSTKRIIRRK